MSTELPLGYIQDMHSALAIATDPKRYSDAHVQVLDLLKRSRDRGGSEHEVEFRAQLMVLSDRLRKAEEGPKVGVIRHLDALSDDARLRIMRRYCAYCGTSVV